MRHPRPRMRRAVAAAVAVLALAAVTASCTVLPEPDAQQPTSTAPADAARQQESPDATTDPTLAPIEAPTPTASPAEPEPKVSVELIETTPPAESQGGGQGGSSGSGGGTAQGGQGSTAASVTEASTTYAQSLVALANEARAAAGLPALEVSSCARSAAKARAGRALAKSQLEHEPMNFSCDRSWAGENLARHYGNPQAMHNAWMGSPGHRENILRPEFTRIGVGCVAYSSKDRQQPAARSGDVGGQVCAQVFLG